MQEKSASEALLFVFDGGVVLLTEIFAPDEEGADGDEEPSKQDRLRSHRNIVGEAPPMRGVMIWARVCWDWVRPRVPPTDCLLMDLVRRLLRDTLAMPAEMEMGMMTRM